MVADSDMDPNAESDSWPSWEAAREESVSGTLYRPALRGASGGSLGAAGVRA